MVIKNLIKHKAHIFSGFTVEIGIFVQKILKLKIIVTRS
jgi:hypothetical protein